MYRIYSTWELIANHIYPTTPTNWWCPLPLIRTQNIPSTQPPFLATAMNKPRTQNPYSASSPSSPRHHPLLIITTHRTRFSFYCSANVWVFHIPSFIPFYTSPWEHWLSHNSLSATLCHRQVNVLNFNQGGGGPFSHSTFNASFMTWCSSVQFRLY